MSPPTATTARHRSEVRLPPDATEPADTGATADGGHRSRSSAGTGILRGTGRERADWFAVLDAWGAVGRPYRETAGWLREKHGLSAWWAQKLTVEYEQARGTRPPGIRPGGTFEVGASKVVPASLDEAAAAFTDPARRAGWLPDASMRERAVEPGRLRFAWGPGSERLSVTIEALGEDRSQVVVQHDRLPDAEAAADARAAWRERLAALEVLLERRG